MRSISLSELKRFHNCRLKWYWSSAPPRGLGLRSKVDLPELELGRVIHSALQVGYDSDRDFVAAYNQVVSEIPEPKVSRLFASRQEKIDEQRTLGFSMMEGYQDWAEEQDKLYRILATETKFDNVPIPGTDATLSGVIDLVVERHDGLWLIDFKTTKYSENSWTIQDPQATLYTGAAEYLLGQKVKGMIYRFILKKLPMNYADLILKSGYPTTRSNLENLTTYGHYQRAIGVAVLKELVEKCDYPHEGERTLEAYAARMVEVRDEEVFQTRFKAAKKIYFPQLSELRGAKNPFFWEVVEYRTREQIDNYTKYFFAPTCNEIINARWIGPTGLSSSFSNCARCAFKTPCKLVMDGADYRTILHEEFELSPHYAEESEEADEASN